MKPTELLESVTVAYSRLVDEVDQRLRASCDLPLALFQPLSVVRRTRDCRIYDISTALGLTTGGASKIVDRAEGRGLCQRGPNPGDRRSSIITLTPRGERLMAQATKVVDHELGGRWEGLPAALLAAVTAAPHGRSAGSRSA